MSEELKDLKKNGLTDEQVEQVSGGKVINLEKKKKLARGYYERELDSSGRVKE